MTDLTSLGVKDIRDGVAKGDFTAREVAESFNAAVAEAAALNAFIVTTPDHALAAADKVDADRAAGKQLGKMAGVPIGMKDLFATHGVQTTAASHILEGFAPRYESTVSQNLWNAGAGMLGKLNLDQFAMGSSNETSYFGNVSSPWRKAGSNAAMSPGGSSGGSSAAVAARIAPAATGTDTGGSIRQPAAFCGLTGLKPTYGRVSRWGMIAFASSLDQAGPMAWTAEDLALLLQQIAGFDPRDSTSVEQPVPDYLAALGNEVAGLTVGLPSAMLAGDLAPGIAAAVDHARSTLESLGVRIRDIELPTALAGVSAYYVLASAEASTNLSRYDGVRFGRRCADPADLHDLYVRSRAEGFGAEVKRRILTGTYALSVGYYDAYYRQAQKVRRRIRDEFVTAFGEVDAILTPTTPTPAFRLGENTDDPVAMYLQDLFTIPANLAGIPALSMPAGDADGLPVGVQLMGPHFGEPRLLALASAFQRATDHHLRRPAAALETR